MLLGADLVVMLVAWVPLLLTGFSDTGRLPAESLFIACVAIGCGLVIMRYEGLYLSRLCAVRSIEVRLIGRSGVFTALALVAANDRLRLRDVRQVRRLPRGLGDDGEGLVDGAIEPHHRAHPAPHGFGGR